MIKQLIFLIVFSILAIIFLHEIHQGLEVLVTGFRTVTEKLAYVLPGGQLGRIIRESIALILIPVVIGLIVNLIYWLIKKESAPIMMAVIWAVWLILVTLLG